MEGFAIVRFCPSMAGHEGTFTIREVPTTATHDPFVMVGLVVGSVRISDAPTVFIAKINIILPIIIPIPTPLIDITTLVQRAKAGDTLRVGKDRAGGFTAPVVFMPAFVLVPGIAPGVDEVPRPPRRPLPLRLGGQGQTRPGTVGARILPTDADYRMLRILRRITPPLPDWFT